MKKNVPFYKRYRFVSDPFVINSFYTEIEIETEKKHYKAIPKSFRKKNVPFDKCYRFVSGPFDIRYG
jgi:hypothetical protein